MNLPYKIIHNIRYVMMEAREKEKVEEMRKSAGMGGLGN